MRRQAAAALVAVAAITVSGSLTAAAAEPTGGSGSGLSGVLAGQGGSAAPAAGTSSAVLPDLVPGPTAAAKQVRARSVSLTDRDGAPPAGGASLTRVDVTQDVVAKKIVVRLAYATAPTSADPSAVLVVAGTWTDDDTCTASGNGAVLAVQPQSHQSAGQIGSGTTLATSLTGSGTVWTVTTAANAAVGAAAWECAFARTVNLSDTSTVYQTFWAQSLTTTYVPVLTLRADADPTVGARTTRSTQYKVTVHSTGDTAVKEVTVSFKGKGVKLSKKTVSLGTIAADHDRTATVRLRLTTKKTRKVTVTVKGQGAAASKRTVRVLPIAKTTKPRSLAHRYYWGWRTSYYTGWDNQGLYFVDSRWVHVGFPGAGLPTRCSAKKKGCKRYTYSPRTGRLKIGKKKGTASSVAVRYDGVSYYPLAVPKKGTKLAVNLVHRDYSGCNGSVYCSTWTDWLVLDKKGRFTLSSSSISSFGIPGSQTWATSVPADQRGRYRILSHGRIELRYASGKKVVDPIGIQLDVRGKSSPRYEGVVIGTTNYYYDS